MPTLNEITKVFLHGETLESLELNSIISQINSAIRKINSILYGLDNNEYGIKSPIVSIYCRTKENSEITSCFPEDKKEELFQRVSECPTTKGIKYNSTFLEVDLTNNTYENIKGVWTAYPQGVCEELPYEWEVSYKKLEDDSIIYISGPILRSNFGLSGMDGDSILYIYKLFDHELSQIEREENDALLSGLNIEDLEDYGWFDDPQNPTQQYPFEYVSIKKKTNGTWGNFSPIALWAKYSEDGVNGDFLFRVYKRSVTAPETPVGGRYNSPTPSGWEPSVPSGSDPVWSSTKIFKGSGEDTNTWSTPTLEADTVGIDIEYSPDNEKPSKDTLRDNPGDSHPHADHTIWYDASNTTIDLSTMIWRAERKIKNGGYEGEWVITRIKGEELSELQITVTPLNIILDLEDVLASGTDIQIDDVVSTITVYALDGTTLNYNKFGIIDANIYADGYTVNNEQAPLTPALDYLEITGIVGDTLNARTIKIKKLPISLNDSYVYTYNKGHIEVNLLVTVGESLRTMKVEIPWYLNRLGERLTRLKGDLLETLMSKEVFNEGNNSPERIKLNGLISTSASEVITRLEKQISGTNLISDNGWGTSFSSGDIASRRRTQCSPFVYLTPGDYVLSAYINTNAVINNYFELNIKQSNTKVDPSTLLDSYITSEWNSLNIQGILSADPNIEFSGDYYPEGTNNYVRVYFTFTVVGSLETGTYKEGYYTFHFSKLNSSNVGLLTCIRPQLECNSTPTTWSPGPQDFSSEIRQTANEIDLSIKNDFAETGLTIDGENNEIKLTAGLVKFVDSSGENDNPYFLIDSSGKVLADEMEISGVLKSKSGKIAEIEIEDYLNLIDVYTPSGILQRKALDFFNSLDPVGLDSNITVSGGSATRTFTSGDEFISLGGPISTLNITAGKYYVYCVKGKVSSSSIRLLLAIKTSGTSEIITTIEDSFLEPNNGRPYHVHSGIFKLDNNDSRLLGLINCESKTGSYFIKEYYIKEARFSSNLYIDFTHGQSYLTNSYTVGRHRSPFKKTKEGLLPSLISDSWENSDNYTIMEPTYYNPNDLSTYNQLVIPWDYSLSGRRLFLNNGLWASGASPNPETYIRLIAPSGSGMYIYKDGNRYSKYFIPKRSAVEMIGIGLDSQFLGWMILHLYDLHNTIVGGDRVEYGNNLKAIAIGTVTFGSNPTINYKCSNDSINLNVLRESNYCVSIYFLDSDDNEISIVDNANDLIIMLTPQKNEVAWYYDKSTDHFKIEVTNDPCAVDFVIYNMEGF